MEIFDAISEPITRRVTAGLAKIGAVLRSHAWKGAGPAGVTPTQGQALVLLRETPEGMRLAALTRMLGVSAPTASEAAGSLVQKGLALKAPGPDRRSITLLLTPAGKVLADHVRDWPEFLANAVDVLEPHEQANLLRCLVKLVRTLQINGDVPHQRMCVTCRYFRPNAHADEANPHHCAYVDAPFGDRHLRLTCAEHEEAEAAAQAALWQEFKTSPAMQIERRDPKKL